MGIDISGDGVVTVNPNHNDRVLTDVRHPTGTTIHDMATLSIFRRRRVSSDRHDGNPLIYAMKGYHGYTIPSSSRQLLIPQMDHAVSIVIDNFQPEILIPVPSGGLINTELANKIAASSGNAISICECFEKRSIQDVLARALANQGNIPTKLRTPFATVINRLEKSSDSTAPFEMKDISLVDLRKYFQPLAFKGGAWTAHYNDKRVLFVEDTLTTGTTLFEAKRLLLSRGSPASMSVVTMFSKL